LTVAVDDVPPVTLAGLTLSAETAGGRTVRDAVCVAPPYEAEMVTAVDVVTPLVLTAKVAVVAPPATVTLAGGEATAVLLLDSDTRAPPAGAGPLRPTVAVDDVPPVTLAGLTPSEDAAGGVTVSEAVCVTPPEDPEIVTEVEVATAVVLTVKVAVVEPPATATLAGTAATPGALLESDTRTPPLGAGESSVAVPVDELPPITVVRLRLSEDRTGAVTVRDAVRVAPS
jgi:hypothetical protein